MKITILWHVEHEFYNVRIRKGMRTISQSAMRMRRKIYNVEDVRWRYHVVLTLSEKSLLKCKEKGIDSSLIRPFLNKVKSVFTDKKYFWKYEEGRKSERPHFHLLFDLKEKVENKSNEIEKIMDVGDVYNFVDKS
ncbi:MAG: hypothetical protein ACFFAO_06575, partial [Candidatus Hermodarchaeota archaeon]